MGAQVEQQARQQAPAQRRRKAQQAHQRLDGDGIQRGVTLRILDLCGGKRPWRVTPARSSLKKPGHGLPNATGRGLKEQAHVSRINPIRDSEAAGCPRAQVHGLGGERRRQLR
jgi:hypothetical protein